MFLVDTSVWIDYFRRARNGPVERFSEILERGIPFGITGIIYQEILQGAASDRALDTLDEVLSTQRFYHPRDPVATFGDAARLYARCRRAGVTVRSTIDCLIAQVAIDNDLALLHNDGDFERIAKLVPELRLA